MGLYIFLVVSDAMDYTIMCNQTGYDLIIRDYVIIKENTKCEIVTDIEITPELICY